MRIGLISPYDWSYPGGVKSHIEHLASTLRQRGHQVRIITAASGPQGRQIEYGVHKIGWTAAIRMNGSVARIALTADMSGSIHRLIQQSRFDVVHLHEPLVSSLTLVVLRIADQLGIPTVGTFHASSNQRYSTATLAYGVASPFLQGSFERLDSRIAVSEAARIHVDRFFPADYHIVPNGIDCARFANLQPLPGYDDGRKTILFLARLEPRKGLRFLLKAIPVVREYCRGIPLRFVIAGDGPQRERFQRFVQRQGWNDVAFIGFVGEAEKARLYASATVFCVPSTGNESQGITLLEAMAAGTPVVGSAIPGYRTVIPDDSYGLLTPPRDAMQLAWAISQVVRDTNLHQQLSAKGRERARLYDWNRVTSAIEQVYQEAQIERRLTHQAAVLYAGGQGLGPIGGHGMDELEISSEESLLATPVGRIETSGLAISSSEENVVE